jgi:hypothetical protein
MKDHVGLGPWISLLLNGPRRCLPCVSCCPRWERGWRRTSWRICSRAWRTARTASPSPSSSPSSPPSRPPISCCSARRSLAGEELAPPTVHRPHHHPAGLRSAVALLLAVHWLGEELVSTNSVTQPGIWRLNG